MEGVCDDGEPCVLHYPVVGAWVAAEDAIAYIDMRFSLIHQFPAFGI